MRDPDPEFPDTGAGRPAASGRGSARADTGRRGPISQAQPAPVESRPLEQLPPAASPAPQPAPPRAEPTYRTATTRSVTGRVVDAEGRSTTYTVERGDSLIAIARKLDTTVDQLRDDNGIEGSNIRPGQKLKGPRTDAKAYVVASGDTLFAIARRFGVTADAIAEENDIGRNAPLKVGQRLRLPEGFRDRGPIVTTTRTVVEAGEPQAAPATPPPPPSREPERAAPPPTRPAPEPAAEPPATRAVTTRSVTGRVIDVEGKPETYTVRKGDTLIEIARKLDTTVDQLRKDNRIRGSNIQPGDSLKGPRGAGKAYVAGSGDTLDLIARRFSVTAAALRSENGLGRNATIRAGQRIRLPSGYRDRGPVTQTTRQPVESSAPERAAPPVRTPPPEPTPALPPRPQPYTPPATSRPAPPPRATPSRPQPYTSPSAPPVAGPAIAPPVSDAQISQLGRGRFIWPIDGDLVSGFGPKPGNQRNDGINIRAKTGDAVRAAASGDVVYAGDQVPGFGNLVLIKHADGWVTAYGHLSRVDVKMTQKVTQGQQIGQAGSSGGVTEPQLHFEVRYAPSPLDRARPIDPALVLPK
ncbi:LysM peptidoglycan-binding domain-containing protein [Phenylobacterium sp. J367]|uniref:LysM peptidoglycan-binding domain-containing protein n=1 Tax=Phenylobacterium sp. J367 TaxID=2898435 RepID=UPI002151F1D9|nr:LysM peptidoglycan-binding domain-containing protein [Phenylobacterium sp. J367]MCR5879912.1 LysM peptidoglycan-binding domain-containing protein [Phenylobacterium sp. J367]